MSTDVVDPTEKVISIIRETLSIDETIEADTELLESGLLDSLSVIRLIGKVETEFGIRFPMIDLTVENLATPGAMVTLIQRLQSQ